MFHVNQMYTWCQTNVSPCKTRLRVRHAWIRKVYSDLGRGDHESIFLNRQICVTFGFFLKELHNMHVAGKTHVTTHSDWYTRELPIWKKRSREWTIFFSRLQFVNDTKHFQSYFFLIKCSRQVYMQFFFICLTVILLYRSIRNIW
jgi:hypothetical protein